MIGDATSKGLIKVYDSRNFSLLKSFKAHSQRINRIKQLSNGYVATCSGDGTVKLWNPYNNWKLTKTYRNHTGGVRELEFINLDTVATGSVDKTIKIWSISTLTTNATITTNGQIWSLKLFNNGSYLACGLSNNFKILIFNITNGYLVSTLQGHSRQVFDLCLISNELMASSSEDKTIRIWDLTTKETKYILNGHTSNVNGMKLISSDILMSGSSDTTIKLWNITNGTLIATFTNHTNFIVYSVDVLLDSNNDDEIVVSASYDQSIILWNVSTKEILFKFNTDLQIRSLMILDSIKNTTSKENFKMMICIFLKLKYFEKLLKVLI